MAIWGISAWLWKHPFEVKDMLIALIDNLWLVKCGFWCVCVFLMNKCDVLYPSLHCFSLYGKGSRTSTVWWRIQRKYTDGVQDRLHIITDYPFFFPLAGIVLIKGACISYFKECSRVLRVLREVKKTHTHKHARKRTHTRWSALNQVAKDST